MDTETKAVRDGAGEPWGIVDAAIGRFAAPSAAGGGERPGDCVLVPRATLAEALSGPKPCENRYGASESLTKSASAAETITATVPQGADLEGLSAKATQGEWWEDTYPEYDEDGGPTVDRIEGVGAMERGEPESIIQCSERNARFIVALVNAYRSGALVPTTSAPPAATWGREDDDTSPLHRLTEAFWGWQWGGMGERARSYAKSAIADALQRSGLALAHPGSVASASGDQTPWSCDMAAAPADEEVEVGAGRMTFLAKLVPNGSLTMGGKPCDQWQATREGEHPPCWSDGCCWASNEDEDASLLPDRWRRVAPPLASQTEGERP